MGGVSEPTAAARNVGHGVFPGSAQSASRRKKQSSQVVGGGVFIILGRSPLVDQNSILCGPPCLLQPPEGLGHSQIDRNLRLFSEER
jgi:hypothetical protein